MSDHIQDGKVKDIEPASPPEKPSSDATARMQQGLEKTEPPLITQPDQHFQDGQARDIGIRSYQSGDRYYVRAFDKEKTQQLPDSVTTGDAGSANLKMERDETGKVNRARLEDIQTTPSYRNAGIGDRMLDNCEDIARNNKASEIYGLAPSDPETKNWYTHRGYDFRKDGLEVFKKL